MAAGGAAAAAAIAQAIKASGVLIRMKPAEFQKMLSRMHEPLVVIAEGGLFNKNYQYLTSYKGLAFFTKAPAPLLLPAGSEVIVADGIWVPG